MRNVRGTMKRMLGLFLCMVMVITSVPPTAYAAEEGEDIVVGENIIENSTFATWDGEVAGTTSTVQNNWVTYSYQDTATFKENATEGLDVVIPSASYSDWNIQLSQRNLSLLANTQYQVEVKLKSTIDRDVNVKLQTVNAADDGYNIPHVDDDKWTFNLTADTEKTISFITNAVTAATDYGKLYIGLGKCGSENLGEHTITVYSVSVAPIIVEEEPIEPGESLEGNIITNPLFENELTGWFSVFNGAAAVASASKLNPSAIAVNITNTGTEEWGIQLAQENLTLTTGKKYEVSVDLMSTIERKIRVNLEDGATNQYGARVQTVNAGERCTINFVTDNAVTGTIGKFYMALGAIDKTQINTSHTVTVYSVNVVPVEDEEVSSEATTEEATTEEATTEEATTEEPEKEVETIEGNIIEDPTFVNGTASWSTYGVTPTVNGEGGLDFAITNVGSDDWSVQLSQPDLTLTKGKKYTVNVELQSTVARTVFVALQDYQGDANTKNLVEDTVELAAGTKKDIELVTDTLSSTISTGKLYIGLGKVSESDATVGNHTVTIKKVTVIEEEGDPEVGYNKLVWSDEFDGNYGSDTIDANTGLNLSNWSYNIGNGEENNNPGWGNGELQYYTKDAKNIAVEATDGAEDGKALRITAISDTTYDGYGYTSARIHSQGKQYFKYGRLEARIKLDKGQGNWPAFWMLGENFNKGTSWPSCGEIDIMEWASGWSHTLGTLHWSDTSGNHAYNTGYTSNSSLGNMDVSQWHTYAVEWDESAMHFICDDVEYHTIDITGEAFSEFHLDQFFLLNVAVGGSFVSGGVTESDMVAGKSMYVDYVRVYEEGTAPTKYTVSFNSDGGSAVSSQKVVSGEAAAEPTAPTKDGYKFLGWYNGETLYNFETAVTENITLIAKWQEDPTQVKYTVTFDSDGGTAVDSQKVVSGDTAEEPTAPTKKGYSFLGWYNGETLYDFETAVTGNITLTAKWEEKEGIRTGTGVEYDSETGNLTFWTDAYPSNYSMIKAQFGAFADEETAQERAEQTTNGDLLASWPLEYDSDAECWIGTLDYGLDENAYFMYNFYVVNEAGVASCTDWSTITEVSELPEPTEEEVKVTSIKLSATALDLSVGKSETLTATVAPDNATNKDVEWTTSDAKVATVEDGVVTPVASGEATITATAADGSGVTAECKVTVTEASDEPIAVKEVTINKNAVTLGVGESEALVATVRPTNADDTSVTWDSDDKTVATVDENGKVTAKAVGTAKITVTTNDGKFTASCTITVEEKSYTRENKGVEIKDGKMVLYVTDSADAAAIIGYYKVFDSLDAAQAAGLVDLPGVGMTKNGDVFELVINETADTNKYLVYAFNQPGWDTPRVIAIADIPENTTIDVTGVTLDTNSVVLLTGTTQKLVATVAPADANNKKVTWTSADEKVATVSGDGTVVAVAEGVTTITVTTVDGSFTAECRVRVDDDSTDAIKVTGVTLDKETLEMTTLEKVTLTAKVAPENADNTAVKWSSSDSAIAEVDENGVVFARKAGTATITVTTVDGEKTDSCTITITEKPYERGEMGAEIKNGNIIVYVTGITDADLTNGVFDAFIGFHDTKEAAEAAGLGGSMTMTESTSEKGTYELIVGSVSANAGKYLSYAFRLAGLNTPHIIAVDEIPENKIMVTGVTITVEGDEDAEEVVIEEKRTATLIATVSPEDATYKDVTWTSSDDKVATVDAKGVVTGVKAGTATITAIADGAKTATIEVTVKAVAAEGIALDKSVLTLNEGATDTLTVTFKPDNASNQNVTWESSDDKIATVDENGKVTAVAMGTATITAKAEDGGFTAECKVTVEKQVTVTFDTDGGSTVAAQTIKYGETATEPTAPTKKGYTFAGWYVDNTKYDFKTAVTADTTITAKWEEIIVTDIELSETAVELEEEETITISATVTPSDALNTTVEWSSDNKDVATVDENGKITAVASGDAVITAAVGDVKAEVAVKVTAKPVIPTTAEVTFDLADGSEPTTQTVNIGDTVTKPADPTREGYIFAGWYVGKDAYDFATKIEEAITITATWTEILVETITVEPATVTLKVGETAKLEATVTPAEALNKTIEWTSSDETKVTVSGDGTVTAVAEGKVIITATVGNANAMVLVTVNPAEIPKYTVTFNTNGGSTVEAQTVEEGSKVVKPADPTKDGYKFAGWYAGDEEYDFSADVTADMTLTAKWDELASFIVTFDVTGGSPVEVQTVKENGTITEPKAPTKTGYVFTGWSLDGEEFDFTTPVTGNMTLVATWKEITVDRIELSQNTVTMTVGETTTVTADVYPETALNKTVEWATLNPAIATVDADGKITAVTAGTATITAKNGEITAIVNVTVNAPEVPKYTVTFNTDGGSVVSAQTILAGAKVTKPADPTKIGFNFKGWLVNGTAYDFNTAVTGNVTITASWEQIKVTSIQIEGEYTKIAVNKKVRLTAIVTPGNAYDCSVTWSSSNTKWATVDQTGLVKALKAGKNKNVIIKATSADGTVVAEYKIKIMPKAVTKIKLKASATKVKAGKKVKIKATVTPSNKKQVNTTLKWTSSNEAWATVDKKGVVKTLKAGKGKTVTITAYATDGSNKKKTIKIKIK